MPYPNTTNITAAGIQSVTDLFQLSHALSQGLLGPVIALVVYVVTFSLSYKFTGNQRDALVFSSFVTFITALGLLLMEMMDPRLVVFPALIMLLSWFL